jgi:hypothetical protein
MGPAKHALRSAQLLVFHTVENYFPRRGKFRIRAFIPLSGRELQNDMFRFPMEKRHAAEAACRWAPESDRNQGSSSRTRMVPYHVPGTVLVTTMPGMPQPMLLVSVVDRSSV